MGPDAVLDTQTSLGFFLITFTLKDVHVCGCKCHRGYGEVKTQRLRSQFSPSIM